MPLVLRCAGALAAGIAIVLASLMFGPTAHGAPAPSNIAIPSPGAFAVDATTGNLYASSMEAGDNSVVVFDPATGSVIKSLPSPANVRAVAIDSVHRRVYAATDAGTVLVLDADSNTLITTIATGQSQLAAIAVNPDTQTVYATVSGRGFVVFIDGATNTVTGTPFVYGSRDNQLAVDSTSNRVYVGDGNRLSVIDGTSGTVLRSESTSFVVGALVLDTAKRRLYTSGLVGIYVVDLDSLSRLSTIRLSDSIVDNALARSPITGDLLGVAKNDTLTVVSPSTEAVRATVPLPPNSATTARITVDPTRGTVFIAGPTTNSITILRPPSLAGTAPAGTADSPYNFAYTLPTAPATPLRVTKGSLPPGLTLDTDGRVSGTPTSPGTYTFTVTATNPLGPAVSKNESLEIRPAGTAPTIAGTASSGTVGTTYSYRYQTTGNPEPTVTVSGGNLPPGLTLSPEGLLTGTPTSAGTFEYTVTARNGVAPDASLAESLVIRATERLTAEPTSPPAATTPAAPLKGDGSTPPDAPSPNKALAYTGAALGIPLVAAVAMLSLGALLLRRRLQR